MPQFDDHICLTELHCWKEEEQHPGRRCQTPQPPPLRHLGSEMPGIPTLENVYGTVGSVLFVEPLESVTDVKL